MGYKGVRDGVQGVRDGVQVVKERDKGEGSKVVKEKA
jgi:hypothetical protein